MLEKLVKIFHAKSAWHLVKIFLVFSITGSFSVYVSGPILDLLQLDMLITFIPAYWVARLIVITIAYQLSLILVAIVFGELTYFLVIQKKFLNRFKLIKNK